MPAPTVRLPDLRRTGPILRVEIGVGRDAMATLSDFGAPIPSPVTTDAMIDTGSSASVMRHGTGARLGLRPTGVIYTATATSPNVPCLEYAVHLTLGDDIALNTTLIEMPLTSQHIGCLIGRDILARGVLIYLGSGDGFTLSI